MQLVLGDKTKRWADFFDKVLLICASLVPVGIVIGNAGFESMIAITGLAWLFRSIILRQNPFKILYKNKAFIAWLLWIIVIISSMIINGPGSKGAAHDIVFIRFFLFGCAVIDFSYRKRNISKYLAWGLVAGVLFGTFNMTICFIFGFDLFGHEWIRYSGKLKEAARMAGLFSMAFPILVFWPANKVLKGDKKRLIIVFAALFAILTLFWIGIRTSIIASAFGLAIGIFFYRYKQMKRIEMMSWCTATMAIIITLYKMIEQGNYTSFDDRIGIWKVVWVMWQNNPILGSSISAFQDTYAQVAASGMVSPYISSTGVPWMHLEATHAHNLLLMLLASTGILGLCSFIGLFICSCLSISKNKKAWRYGLYTWPFVFMIVGLTGWNIYHSWYYALFSFFIVFATTSGMESSKEYKIV